MVQSLIVDRWSFVISLRMRAKRAIIASQSARPFGKLRAGSFARLAQIPRGAQNACSG
jgi:hypothetical protein